jgi:hypothetical protein
MASTYNILERKSKRNGKVTIHYTLRFSSQKIANVLTAFGIIPRKSLVAKVIGLENNRHFWRGVLDGDGWLGIGNGHDGDKIVLVGSYNLLYQFKEFIERNIPGTAVHVKPDGNHCRLFVYSETARILAELLYDNCTIALDRKLAKARLMFDFIQ